MKNQSTKGFTLIELLMVIAIIGILAGILIPTVGAVRKQANIAASKAQLSNYVTAITMFKGEYGYYPFVQGASDREVKLATESDIFIKTLSGRDPATGEKVSVSEAGGNRRLIAFHSFSESEFLLNDDDTVSDTQLADRFNNTNMIILIDGDGNGRIDLPGGGSIKQPVTAYVEEEEITDSPGYTLYD